MANESYARSSHMPREMAKMLKCVTRPHLGYQVFAGPISQQRINLERQNQELTALRDWLLPMLMNGQVRVG